MPQNDNHPLFFLSPIFSIFLDSLKIIFIQNPSLFFSLYLLTTFPLSLFLTSSAVSTTTRRLKTHLFRLEWLHHAVPIWVEAANIRDELRADSKKLLGLKLLHGLPVLGFSLLGLITIVGSTFAFGCRKKKRVSLRSVVLCWVKLRWGPPLLTCLVNFLIWVGWGYLDRGLGGFAVEYAYVAVVQAVVEVGLMGVLSVALVVSVIEGRAGFEAVRAGWGLMRGRRLSGWALSGLVLLGSGLIGREMIGVMDGGDEGWYTWTVEMRVGLMIGLVVLLGWFILWSYVIFGVYYFECRKRNVIKEGEYVDIIDENEIIII